MFGLPDDELLANLERLRRRLCCYMGETCDCKFGTTAVTSEQTGCPEIRQAMEIIRGNRASIVRTRDLWEDSARNQLADIRRVLER
jgi:hypothetical protein